MANAKIQTRPFDLARFTEGKKFTDGEHQKGERIGINLHHATSRKRRVSPRMKIDCLATIHEETLSKDCVMITPIYHSKFTLWGTEVDMMWLCRSEDCDKYEDWF